MPILPIDLQTLFSHLNHVSKDQAVQKEVIHQNQALHGQEIVEKTIQKDHTVTETEEVGEGMEKIKNKKKEQKQEEKEASGKEKKEKKDKDEIHTVVYKDPNLGHHIDIIG